MEPSPRSPAPKSVDEKRAQIINSASRRRMHQTFSRKLLDVRSSGHSQSAALQNSVGAGTMTSTAKNLIESSLRPSSRSLAIGAPPTTATPATPKSQRRLQFLDGSSPICTANEQPHTISNPPRKLSSHDDTSTRSGLAARTRSRSRSRSRTRDLRPLEVLTAEVEMYATKCELGVRKVNDLEAEVEAVRARLKVVRTENLAAKEKVGPRGAYAAAAEADSGGMEGKMTELRKSLAALYLKHGLRNS
mmetsp:Transcript_11718/g.31005  ORF Transcript_11718/g.31005 Transcript_11718/m.31005 type:complete len:247 (-) Transcript_11718:71-811(-)